MMTRQSFEHHGGQAFRPQLARSPSPSSHERDWAAVRVVHVELESTGPTVPAGHRRVRAGIRLGSLTPADVHVHLTSAVEDAAGKTRMTCARTYGNGTYLFDALVAEDRLGSPGTLRVLVERRTPLGVPDGRAGSLLLELPAPADDR